MHTVGQLVDFNFLCENPIEEGVLFVQENQLYIDVTRQPSKLSFWEKIDKNSDYSLNKVVGQVATIMKAASSQLEKKQQKEERCFWKNINLIEAKAEKRNGRWFIRVLSTLFKNLKCEDLGAASRALQTEINKPKRPIQQVPVDSSNPTIMSQALYICNEINRRLEKWIKDHPTAKFFHGKKDGVFLLSGGGEKTKIDELFTKVKEITTDVVQTEFFEAYKDEIMISVFMKIIRENEEYFRMRLNKHHSRHANSSSVSVNLIQQAIDSLTGLDRDFLKSLCLLLHINLNFDWKLRENSTEESIISSMLIAIPSVKKILGEQAHSLIQNYERIFNPSKQPESIPASEQNDPLPVAEDTSISSVSKENEDSVKNALLNRALDLCNTINEHLNARIKKHPNKPLYEGEEVDILRLKTESNDEESRLACELKRLLKTHKDYFQQRLIKLGDCNLNDPNAIEYFQANISALPDLEQKFLKSLCLLLHLNFIYNWKIKSKDVGDEKVAIAAMLIAGSSAKNIIGDQLVFLIQHYREIFEN